MRLAAEIDPSRLRGVVIGDWIAGIGRIITTIERGVV